MDKKESLYLNVVKGAAIFFMLWGHCIEYCANGTFNSFDNQVFEFIYTFNMPLFMLVSGYLFYFSFQKRELKPLLVHRIQGMLQPIFCCGVFNQLLMVLFYKAIGLEYSLFNGSIFSFTPFVYWFSWAVLSNSTAVAISCKVTDKLWLQCILLVACIGMLALFPNADLHIFLYPFFLLGFFFARYRAVIPGWVKNLKYLSLILFPALLPFYESKHSIYLTPIYSRAIGITASLKINLFRFVVALAGSLCVMVILWEIVRRVADSGLLSRAVSAVARVGRDSLQVYCISMSVLSGFLPEIYWRVMERIGYNVFEGRMWVYNLVFTPLLAAAYAALICGIVTVLRKLRIHSLIFGR